MTAQDNEITEYGDEPVKVTEKLREELSEEEPIESKIHVLEPATEQEVALEAENEQENTQRFQQTTQVKDQDRKPKKTKGRTMDTRKGASKGEPESLSKLHHQLTKHFATSNKTDVTLRDIRKQLVSINKKADIKHHQIIRDLQVQLREIERKINKIDNSVAALRSKKTVQVKKIKRPKKKTKQGKSNNKKRHR
jgi:hypothetical protein